MTLPRVERLLGHGVTLPHVERRPNPNPGRKDAAVTLPTWSDGLCSDSPRGALASVGCSGMARPSPMWSGGLTLTLVGKMRQ